MASLNEIKDRLRQELKDRRAGLEKNYMYEANADILTRLLSYPVFHQVDSIFCYVNTEFEPDTRTVIECAWQMGKTVAVPKCLPDSGNDMQAIVIHSWDELSPGAMGILEPREELCQSQAIQAYKLDLAIVPCLSADKNGGRIGHGAGYYDRFLKGLSIYKYCLCFERMMVPEIPMGDDDIRMDLVISESGIYRTDFRLGKARGNSTLNEKGKGDDGFILFKKLKSFLMGR